jgi:hypothetical protein
LQQFSESLRDELEGLPTLHESLVSFSSTIDWQLYKSALVHDILKSRDEKAEQQRDKDAVGGDRQRLTSYAMRTLREHERRQRARQRRREARLMRKKRHGHHCSHLHPQLSLAREGATAKKNSTRVVRAAGTGGFRSAVSGPKATTDLASESGSSSSSEEDEDTEVDATVAYQAILKAKGLERAGKYRPSTGNDSPQTQFVFKPHDPMLEFLLHREKGRKTIARDRQAAEAEALRERAAEIDVAPDKTEADRDKGDPHVPNEAAKEDANANANANLARNQHPSPLVRRRKLRSRAAAAKVRHERQLDGDDGGNLERHRVSKFAHSSKYYDLKNWTAACPLTVEHMRLLQPQERAMMNANRKKKFHSILAHQVHEQVAALHRSSPSHAKKVLKETAHPDEDHNHHPTTLRAKTLGHMMEISLHSHR